MLIFTTGLWNTHWFRYFPLPFDLAIQPLVFLYVASLTSPARTFHSRQLLHFIPFVMSVIFSVSVYINVLSAGSNAEKDVVAAQLHFDSIKQAEDILSMFSGIIYWLAAYNKFVKYRKWLFMETSNTAFPTYIWLRNVIVCYGILFVLLIVNIMLDLTLDFGRSHFFHWQVLFIYLAGIIYYMGLRGYQLTLPDTFVHAASNPSGKTEPITTVAIPQAIREEIVYAVNKEKVFLDPLLNPPAASNPSERTDPVITVAVPNAVQEETLETYNKETVFLDPELSLTGSSNSSNKRELATTIAVPQAVQESIVHAFNKEKVFLDPELSLPALAKKLDLSPSILSQFFNLVWKKNFRNVVNDFRIEEVKQRLLDTKSAHLSILGIAYECGFNSEASFYRIFKSAVGCSPKEYIQKKKKSSQN